MVIISGSPTCQYRNNFSTFFVQKYAKENNLQIDWIFTETGYGKGPADGVGATMKTAIDKTVPYNPRKSITNAGELLQEWLDLDMKIYLYD